MVDVGFDMKTADTGRHGSDNLRQEGDYRGGYHLIIRIQAAFDQADSCRDDNVGNAFTGGVAKLPNCHSVHVPDQFALFALIELLMRPVIYIRVPSLAERKDQKSF